MKRIGVLFLIAAMSSLPMVLGCDRTVSEERTVKETDDTKVEKVEKTTESPDGTVTKEKQKTVEEK